MSANPEKEAPETQPAPVPFAVHEGALAFARETITRLWVAVLVEAVVILAIVALGVYAFLQYDYVSETVTVESSATGHANYIGANGDIYNGEGYSPQKEANP